MDGTAILDDAMGRLPELVHSAVAGLDVAVINDRIDGTANSIGWLIWHLTRTQDDHVADVAGTEQVWTADGWAARFALPLDQTETGWNHTSEEVAAVRVADPALLTGYYDAVHARTVEFLRGKTDTDLDLIVDDRWDPPVTLGVRMVSVVDDCLEHAAQAHFVRGILERRR